MTFEIQNSLKSVIETVESTWKLEEPKKGIKQVLKGLDSQVDALKQTTKDLFSKLDNHLQLNWDHSLEKIKNKIFACKKLADLPIKEEKDLLKDLTLLNTDCDKNFIALQELLENSDINDMMKLKNLNNINDRFFSASKATDLLFKEINHKLKRLKTKIELQDPILTLPNDNDSANQLLSNLILRIKKVAPSEAISSELKKSFDKDAERSETFNALITSSLETLVKYKTLDDRIERTLCSLKTLPKITAFCEKLQKPKAYFETLKNHLENISTHKLASGFVEKYQKETLIPKILTKEENFYKRDLSEFFDSIETYKLSLENFAEIDEALAELDQSMFTFLPDINESLKEITLVIETIENRKDDLLDFVNDNMGLPLKKQKQDSIEQLNLLKNEIEQKWNQFCLSLNGVKNQRDHFITFKDITEKMGRCYLLAEDIQGKVRNLRKTENRRDLHFSEFNLISIEFNNLCDLILKNNEQNSKYWVKALDVDNGSIHQSVLKKSANSNRKKSYDSLTLKSNKRILSEKSIESNSKKSYDDLTLKSINRILSEKSSYDDLTLSINQISPEKSAESNSKKSYGLLTLKEEYDLVMKKGEPINRLNSLEENVASDQMAGYLGLVWTSEDEKNEANKAFLEQKTALENELNKYKENIHQAFTKILPDICRIATNEINREGETLSFTKDSYYDERFTEAYYSESRTGQAVQVLGDYVAKAFVYGGSIVTQKFGFTSTMQKELMEIQDEPIHFDPVQSPFDQMKQII